MKSGAIAAGALTALILAGCGSSSSSTTTSVTASNTTLAAQRHGVTEQQATAFWRGQVASQFDGVVSQMGAAGDGRGCVRKSSTGGLETFSCTAYVRNAQNSLSSGKDVIGTLIAGSNGPVSAKARVATGNQIQDWFASTPGDQGYTGS
jgi:hypothetical protein